MNLDIFHTEYIAIHIEFYNTTDPVIARVHDGLGYMSEAGAVSDRDSIMSTIDQGALISCYEASSLETSVTSLYQEYQPTVTKPR